MVAPLALSFVEMDFQMDLKKAQIAVGRTVTLALHALTER
jgi:hypothetical protein